MARIGDECVWIGDEGWLIGSETATTPTAVITPTTASSVVGRPVYFYSGSSSTTDALDTLHYSWEVETPPGSKVIAASTTTSYSLIPDVPGLYQVTAVVRGSNGGCARATGAVVVSKLETAVDSRTLPEVAWIWQTLADFWQQLDLTDREMIEAFWRGLSQLTSAELLELYNIDRNKSIDSIQQESAIRWVSVKPRLDLTEEDYLVFHEEETVAATLVSSGGLYSGVATYTGSLVSPAEYQEPGILTDSYSILLRNPPIQGQKGRVVVKLGDVTFQNFVSGISEDSLLLSSPISSELFPQEVQVTWLPENESEILASISGDSSKIAGLVQGAEIGQPAGTYVRTQDSVWSADGDLSVHTTLVSTTDLFDAGVRVGDVIHFEVTNRERTRFFTVSASIVGVSRNRASVQFEPLTTDLWASDATLIAGASTLNIPGVTETSTGATYTLAAAAIGAEFNTPKFRRKHFHRPIYSSDLLILADNAFYFRATHITRNSMIPISELFSGFMSLYEYIEPPELSDNELTLHGKDGFDLALNNPPISLKENQDYIVIRDEYRWSGLEGTANSDTVTAVSAEFLTFGVNRGDTLRILNSPARGEYEILAVTETTLTLTTNIAADFTDADMVVVPALRQNYIKLISNFDYSNPLPDLMWSETAVYDNRRAIEANFGYVVSLPYSDWERFGYNTNYLTAVATMLRTRMGAATGETVKSGVSILSGVPSSEYRGQILDIDLGYAINADLENETTRVVIQDVDADNFLLDTVRVYTFPSLNSQRDPDFVGLATNPRTGKVWQVGDLVERYELLSKGIVLQDRVSHPTIVKGARNFHTARVVVDALSFPVNDLSVGYLHDFVMEAKPHYTYLFLVLRIFLRDEIPIDDEVYLKYLRVMFDHVGHLGFGAEIYDEFLGKIGRMDEANAMLRSVWPITDLTINGLDEVQSVVGGFVTHPASSDGNMIWDNTYEDKDLLFITTGPYLGLYFIEEVLNDQDLRISEYPSGAALTLADLGDEYDALVIRPNREIHIKDNSSHDGAGSEYLTFDVAALHTDDCSSGDLVSHPDLAGEPVYTVREIALGAGTRYEKARVTPVVTGSASTEYTWVSRRELSSRERWPRRGETPTITVSAAGVVTLEDNTVAIANAMGHLIEPGDTLRQAGLEYPITAVSTSSDIWTMPKLPAGTYSNTEIVREGRGSVLDVLDQREYSPVDHLTLKVSGAALLVDTTATSDQLVLPVGFIALQQVKCGQMIHLVNGADAAIDIGEGLGNYRIVDILDPTTVVVNAQMTATGKPDFELWYIEPQRRIYE